MAESIFVVVTTHPHSLSLVLFSKHKGLLFSESSTICLPLCVDNPESVETCLRLVVLLVSPRQQMTQSHMITTCSTDLLASQVCLLLPHRSGVFLWKLAELCVYVCPVGGVSLRERCWCQQGSEVILPPLCCLFRPTSSSQGNGHPFH